MTQRDGRGREVGVWPQWAEKEIEANLGVEIKAVRAYAAPTVS